MDQQDKVNSTYNRLIKEYGYSPLGVGWGVKDRRDIRFKALISEWEIENCRILDFGCGFGDLYGYLKRNNIKTDYLGLDINHNILNIASKIYPDANFLCADILKESDIKKVDYIFSSGVFNNYRRDSNKFRKEILEKLNELSIKGFAINFLSSLATIRYPDLSYTKPWVVLEECFKFSNNVTLRNSYMPFEFTIYVNKNFKIDTDQVIYQINNS